MWTDAYHHLFICILIIAEILVHLQDDLTQSQRYDITFSLLGEESLAIIRTVARRKEGDSDKGDAVGGRSDLPNAVVTNAVNKKG